MAYLTGCIGLKLLLMMEETSFIFSSCGLEGFCRVNSKNLTSSAGLNANEDERTIAKNKKLNKRFIFILVHWQPVMKED
jgi:hypothetical protein